MRQQGGNQPQPQPQQQPFKKKLSVEQIQFMADQAGELAAVNLKMFNDQVEKGIEGGPAVPEARIAIAIRHAGERTRMALAHSNETIALQEMHDAARAALLKKQARELEEADQEAAAKPDAGAQKPDAGAEDPVKVPAAPPAG